MRKFLLAGLGISLALAAGGCGKRRNVAYEVPYVPPAPALSQTYIHKYGMEVESKEWNQRGQNGQVVSTLKNGVVTVKNFQEGYLEGESTYTFPHSRAIERVENYAQGRLVKEQENYLSGLPKKIIEYHSPSVMTMTVMYENGSPQYREEYEEGKLLEGDYYTTYRQVESRVDQGEGKRINRDGFGQLLSEDKILFGDLASRTIFYPNGAPKEVISFANGKINGPKKTFLPDGEPQTIEEWVNDRPEGLTIFFQNGEKVAEVPFMKGEKNGVEQRFRDGLSVVEEITWKNGKKHGICYRHIGDDTLVEWYFNGKQVSETEFGIKSSRQY